MSLVIVLGVIHQLVIAGIIVYDHLLSHEVTVTVTDRLIINSTKKNIRGRL